MVVNGPILLQLANPVVAAVGNSQGIPIGSKLVILDGPIQARMGSKSNKRN